METTQKPIALIPQNAENELDRLIGWVRAAESRLALILPLSTAMLGTLAVLIPPYDSWTVLGGIVVSFAVVLLVLCIIFAAVASFPRTSGPKGSLVYFGGIASMELTKYLSEIKSCSNEAYFIELHTQCHRNAQIAEKKYYWIQRSMVTLFASSLPWGAAIYILYAAKC